MKDKRTVIFSLAPPTQDHKRFVDMDSWVENDQFVADFINALARRCRQANDKWWRDLQTGEKITRNKGELLMLMVSEIAEAMEGERKNLMDDKLPHRKMAEVELADALIRMGDYTAEYGYDLGGAFVEKMKYNESRADHNREERMKENGKKF